MNYFKSIKKIFLSVFFFTLFFGFAKISFATTINAISCNQSDVQAAINFATSGDTVIIPTGECHWTSIVRWTQDKSITIQGSGVGSTVLVNDLPFGSSDWFSAMFWINSSLGDGSTTLRITNIEFKQGTGNGFGAIYIYGNNHNVRIDHNKFYNIVSRPIQLADWVLGVVDHNDFYINGFTDSSHTSTGILITHRTWNGETGGNGSWSAPLSLGTINAVFVEDNKFYYTGASCQSSETHGSAIDAYGGARYVFRHNYSEVYAINHGPDSGGSSPIRGTRSYEIYNNTFNYCSSSFFTANWIRGGTGVIYNNIATNMDTSVSLSVCRISNSGICAGSQSPYFLQCNGSSLYDGNYEGRNGYPCMDQIGRSTDLGIQTTQSNDPLYIWDNTPSTIMNSTSSYLTEGVDYVLGIARPGYNAFAYPHPLTIETDTTPPSAPSTITIALTNFNRNLANVYFAVSGQIQNILEQLKNILLKLSTN